MKLLEEFSKISLLEEIDQLKKQVHDLRPFTKETEQRIFQKFRLDWNYHSNAIEGNPYTYGETVAFIMHGITAQGKKLKDHLDIQGHDEAIKLMMSMIADDRGFSENDIRELHKIVLQKEYFNPARTTDGKETRKLIKIGQYKDAPNHVKTSTGAIHYYATPEETPIKMAELVEWYRIASQNKKIHPLVLAAVFHHKFVAIHPFDDGNGRLGRILMNFILMKNHYPPVVIPLKERDQYFATLSQADAGEMIPLVEYIGEGLKHSLNVQLRGAKGEVIMEETDLDKEIALVKVKANSIGTEKFIRHPKQIQRILQNSTLPLFFSILQKCENLNDLFSKFYYKIYIDHAEIYRETEGTNSFKQGIIYPSSGQGVWRSPYVYHNVFFDLNDIKSYQAYANNFSDKTDILYKVADFKSFEHIPQSSIFNISKLSFQYFFEEFNKNQNYPNTDINISIDFSEEEYYYINYFDEEIKKLYHEDLTEQEIVEIRDSLIRPVLKEIEGWMKNDK